MRWHIWSPRCSHEGNNREHKLTVNRGDTLARGWQLPHLGPTEVLCRGTVFHTSHCSSVYAFVIRNIVLARGEDKIELAQYIIYRAGYEAYGSLYIHVFDWLWFAQLLVRSSVRYFLSLLTCSLTLADSICSSECIFFTVSLSAGLQISPSDAVVLWDWLTDEPSNFNLFIIWAKPIDLLLHNY